MHSWFSLVLLHAVCHKHTLVKLVFTDVGHCLGSCLLVFGESGGRFHHNSLFKLPLNTFQWEKVRVSNPSSGPQRKTNFGMVSDRDNQHKLCFLGIYTLTEGTDYMRAH